MRTEFKIIQLKRNPQDELVVEVNYVINFKHGGQSDRYVGSETLTGDASSADFIPFSALTEMVVITWVEEALGAEKIAKIESMKLASLQARVDKINNPEFLLGKPWSDFRFNFGRLLK
tara:strand:- start:10000 stop:10353 length:354 start_codon:yes stop_codon:yes gene_type:complete